MTSSVAVRRGTYVDSVRLMQVTREAGRLPGITAALVAMATPTNLELLAAMGLARPDGAGPDDLVVALEARDWEALSRAFGVIEEALARAAGPGAPGGFAQPGPPRTVRSAARRLPDANLALVSVPGQHAFTEAMDALEAGLSVMVFSDNVSLEEEVTLKEEAERRHLLVMGPDCGTAMINGVGLGFANVVRPGPVGLVAASGTGSQQVVCLLEAAGIGTSHVIGVGGRDLSEPVGARSCLRALGLLDADPATQLIVVVSKPPSPEIAAQVRDAATGCSTPTLLGFLGLGQPDLTSLAEQVVAHLGRPAPSWPRWSGEPGQQARPGALRGLFSGGSLCEEATAIAAQALGPIRSNVPLDPAWALPDDLRPDGHVMIDFGDDRLTTGRPHPMIDPTLRRERLAAEAADPTCGVVLLDVVLGHGADPDPAAWLAPAIAAARAGGGPAVVVSLCGTPGDPQGLEAQAGQLAGAGASVHLSNAEAARQAVALVRDR